MARPPDKSSTKNLPLIEDVRFLGRILGEVIREQEGVAAYELIERIRQLAVAYRIDHDAKAGRALDRMLVKLSLDQAVSVVRAFSYFSHLANLAEDRDNVRRLRAEATSGKSIEGTLALTFQRIRKQRIDDTGVTALLEQAYLAPVLTAHPTEVQRQSVLDAERAIAHLLARRDELATDAERDANQAGMRARVAQLWQTRMLRTSKLSVSNEIENALAYYQSTFLREIPRIYEMLERALPGQTIPTFLHMGNWIGGDRDGNPNVDAQTLEIALSRQCETALRFYLTEVHELGSELSMSSLLVPVTADLQALADRSGDDNVHRVDEPYRRALIGIYARLAGTLHALTGTEALRHAIAPGRPYADAAAVVADLRIVESSLGLHFGSALAGTRLKPLIRALQVFGFHLATIDLRQSSDRHESVVAELLAFAHVEPDYSALDEANKVDLLMRLLRDPRGLHVHGAGYGDQTRGELAIFAAAARRSSALRAPGHPPRDHLAHRGRERPARGARAAEGMWTAARRARPVGADARRCGRRPDRRAALRDHRRPAPGRDDHARLLRAARHRGTGPALRQRAGHHAGLLGQQQGRGLLHEQLGAVLRGDGAEGPVRAAQAPRRPHVAPVPRARRHRRSRRRAELPGDPRAAAGHRERTDPADRAG